MAASEGFKRAPQLRAFLLYVCERALRQGIGDIGEQEIGVNVLGRRPDYNPNDDNIVRVQARHLRNKLQQYFENEGAAEPFILTIPKGSYVPRLEIARLPVELPVPVQPARQKISLRPNWWWAAAGAGMLAILAVAIFWTHAGQNSRVRQPAPDPLWSHVFQHDQKTNIVLADGALIELQELLGIDLSLKDYLRPDYPGFLLKASSTEMRRVAERLTNRQTTFLADATVGARLIGMAAGLGIQPSLRYARHLNAREFKTDNFVLLGSRRGIPWVDLFEPWLNFPLDWDRATGQCFLGNRSPQPGEPTEFRPTPGADLTYADIAFLPNLDKTGTVLILNGIDMIGAEAAGEFVLNSGFSSRLAAMIGTAAGGRDLPFFELLIRVRSAGGTAAKTEVEAWRVIDPRRL
ncbi:MAG TPA: hypothetical protein VG672_10335 [Bryobacteraceae bacterium]|nr:hypothetical protein [Bryobacteraceae bacterium]